jgi:hypothetical protein
VCQAISVYNSCVAYIIVHRLIIFLLQSLRITLISKLDGILKDRENFNLRALTDARKCKY